MGKFIVIGGINHDTLGFIQNNSPVLYSSNPCITQTSYGGVAYNIARQLSQRNHHVRFVSLIGDDEKGRNALNDAQLYNINPSSIIKIKSAPTSSYFSFLKKNREMLISFSDMSIMSFLTPSLLEPILHNTTHNDALIIDANTPKETCEYLYKWSKNRACFFAGVAVSACKMKNFLAIINKFDCLIMNRHEAFTLAGNSKNLEEVLKNLALPHVAITDGAKGVSIISKGKKI
ncbi:MAG: hypothetical protein KC505_02175, partial [Myxococcales bacterium]|nr:hypothetical protein [Myxococcales bacterium]